MSFIATKFHETLLSGFRGVALTNCFSSISHFGQISKFKKGVIPGKKLKRLRSAYHTWSSNTSWAFPITSFLINTFPGWGSVWTNLDKNIWSANSQYNCEYHIMTVPSPEWLLCCLSCVHQWTMPLLNLISN